MERVFFLRSLVSQCWTHWSCSDSYCYCRVSWLAAGRRSVAAAAAASACYAVCMWLMHRYRLFRTIWNLFAKFICHLFLFGSARFFPQRAMFLEKCARLEKLCGALIADMERRLWRWRWYAVRDTLARIATRDIISGARFFPACRKWRPEKSYRLVITHSGASHLMCALLHVYRRLLICIRDDLRWLAGCLCLSLFVVRSHSCVHSRRSAPVTGCAHRRTHTHPD